MNNIIGKVVLVDFGGGCFIEGVVKYQPLKSYECWIVESIEHVNYVKNFDYISIKKETPND